MVTTDCNWPTLFPFNIDLPLSSSNSWIHTKSRLHSPFFPCQLGAHRTCEGTAFPFYQTHSFSLAFPAPQGIRTLSYPSPLLFPFFSPTFVLLVYSYS